MTGCKPRSISFPTEYACFLHCRKKAATEEKEEKKKDNKDSKKEEEALPAVASEEGKKKKKKKDTGIAVEESFEFNEPDTPSADNSFR